MEQMKYLLALVDDSSKVVRESVKIALLEYGDDLESVLDQAGATEEQREEIAMLLDVPDTDQLFEVGQMVKHKRYGYRAVIVSVDERCRASDDWYKSNRTQPERGQPWYHVLADGSDQVYYPAQTSLEADESSDEIDNPQVKKFFSAFEDGAYVRNITPWPE